MFDGTALVALGYTARAARWQLGSVDPLESGALLVWGGDGPAPPVGELHEENGGLRLTAVAAERAYCHGRAVVPNVSRDVLRAGPSVADLRAAVTRTLDGFAFLTN